MIMIKKRMIPFETFVKKYRKKHPKKNIQKIIQKYIKALTYFGNNKRKRDNSSSGSSSSNSSYRKRHRGESNNSGIYVSSGNDSGAYVSSGNESESASESENESEESESEESGGFRYIKKLSEVFTDKVRFYHFNTKVPNIECIKGLTITGRPSTRGFIGTGLYSFAVSENAENELSLPPRRDDSGVYILEIEPETREQLVIDLYARDDPTWDTIVADNNLKDTANYYQFPDSVFYEMTLKFDYLRNISENLYKYIFTNENRLLDSIVTSLKSIGMSRINKREINILKRDKQLLKLEGHSDCQYIQPLTYLLHKCYNVTGVVGINNNPYGSVFWSNFIIKVKQNSSKLKLNQMKSPIF